MDADAGLVSHHGVQESMTMKKMTSPFQILAALFCCIAGNIEKPGKLLQMEVAKTW
jgi:hypothetical protein